MIILPETPAAIEGLNSYYLRLDRLLEHYQGELEGGAVHLKAATAEAIVYFDESGPLGGTYRDGRGEHHGAGLLDTVRQAADRHNFLVAVYALAADQVHFWTSLPYAEALHRDLSAEFTDLEGLIKKMQAERLSGYIEVVPDAAGAVGRLFFRAGRFLGLGYDGRRPRLDRRRQPLAELVGQVRQAGGVFHVLRIGAGPPPSPAPTAVAEPPDERQAVIEALQALVTIADNTLRTHRRVRRDFATLLKKKFVQKADRYEFLDPFAAELTYRDGRLTFDGEAPPARLARAVAACVFELFDDLKLGAALRTNLHPWRARYAEALTRWQVNLE